MHHDFLYKIGNVTLFFKYHPGKVQQYLKVQKIQSIANTCATIIIQDRLLQIIRTTHDTHSWGVHRDDGIVGELQFLVSAYLLQKGSSESVYNIDLSKIFILNESLNFKSLLTK